MTSITEQAQKAAEEIERGIYKAFCPDAPDDDVDLTEWVKTTTHLDIAAIITKHIHPASVTEAIEEALRDATRIMSDRAAGGRMLTTRAEAQAALNKCTEALESLQGKAGVSEHVEIARRDDLINHMRIHSGYLNCGYRQMTTEQKELYDAIWAKEVAAMNAEDAATTPASVEAPVGTGMEHCPQCGYSATNDFMIQQHIRDMHPEQQSPRVCGDCGCKPVASDLAQLNFNCKCACHRV